MNILLSIQQNEEKRELTRGNVFLNFRNLLEHFWAGTAGESDIVLHVGLDIFIVVVIDEDHEHVLVLLIVSRGIRDDSVHDFVVGQGLLLRLELQSAHFTAENHRLFLPNFGLLWRFGPRTAPLPLFRRDGKLYA